MATGGWVTITPDQWEKEPTKYVMDPHSPAKLYKSIPWVVCRKCGLVYLKNDFTTWCIKKGCLAELHPGYQHAKRGR